MEETMNMSKLDITRDRSRQGNDPNKNDDTTFIRPATPLRISNVGDSMNKTSYTSKSRNLPSRNGHSGNGQEKVLQGVHKKEEHEYQYAFQSRPRIVNDF